MREDLDNRKMLFMDFDWSTNTKRIFDLDSYNKEKHDSYGNIKQSTELKDKNGNEIFDGSIIKYTKHKGLLMESFIAVVVYDTKYAAFGYRIKDHVLSDFITHFTQFDELKEDFLNHCEVVGDVYRDR